MDITIPPGVVYQPTKSDDSSNWREVHLIRWDEGKLKLIGPWEKIGFTTPASNVRAIHRWNDLSGGTWVAYLCEGHLYVDDGDDLVDISPTPAIEAPSTDFTVGGYGDDTYSLDEYGDARSSRSNRLRYGDAFTLRNWGETLLAMSSVDGRLLQWTPSNPIVPAVVVTDAPVSNFSFDVTPERNVILFQGGGNPNKFQWCDEEDIEEWTPGVSTKAGSYLIEPFAPIIGGHNLGDAGNLIFTPKRAYLSRYLGLPFVFDRGSMISEGNTPISPASFTKIGGGGMWPSTNGWWLFDGTAVRPVPCDVWHWITENINWTAARFYAFAVDMTTQGEIWWFFPSGAVSRNTHMVIYNYRSKWWSMSEFGRTAGAPPDFISYPVLADETTIYRHNSGSTWSGTAKPFAETFPIHFKKGAELITLQQMMPEFVGDATKIRFSIATRNKSNPDKEYYTSQRQIQENGFVDIMVTGREHRVRMDYIGTQYRELTLGPLDVSVVLRGRKGK